MNIEEKIKQIIAKRLKIDKPILNSSFIIRDLGADSIDVIYLYHEIVKEFGINVSEK
jgi:acyl carrier protein